MDNDFYPHTLGDHLIPVPHWIRIIGVADLMHGAYIRMPNRLYVSMREAIHRETQMGETVELHFEMDDFDNRLLSDRKALFLERWAKAAEAEKELENNSKPERLKDE